MTVEGVAALVSALLQPGSRLRDLRLANNWFGPAGVRALTRPYPGAFSFLDGQRWIIQSCALLPDIGIGSESAGMILGPVVSPIAAACGLAVAGSDGTIMILELENSDGQILSGTALSDTKWTGKVWTNE